jgi:hypothetical protein
VREDEFEARYGRWRVRTAISNVASAEATGPHSFFKTAGPARLAITNRGVTFASNGLAGVARTRQDLLDNRRLGVGVVLGVLPRLSCEGALRPLVEHAIGFASPQVITEAQQSFDLFTAFGEDVEIDDRIGAVDKAMLVPIGLSNTQFIPRAWSAET